MPRSGQLRHQKAGWKPNGGEVEIVPDEPEIVDIAPDTSLFACTFGELGSDMCRWPLGEPSADMQYCAAITSGGPWCRRHRRIAYKPMMRRA